MEDFQFLTCAYFSDGLVKNHQQTSDVMSSKGWDDYQENEASELFQRLEIFAEKKKRLALQCSLVPWLMAYLNWK